MPFRYMFIIACLSLGIYAKAQSVELLDTSSVVEKEYLLKHYQLKQQLYKDWLKQNHSKKDNKILQKNYAAFADNFEEEIRSGAFIFDERFVSYSEQLLQKIVDANSNITDSYKVLVSREPSLNAYCTVDGYIVLNLGVFYYLQNEAQIAGVLAHELSHKLLAHSLKTQKENIESELSDQSKQTIKSIKKQKYNKRTTAFEHFKQRAYSISKRSRQYEFEADSMGYTLFKNTNYNSYDFVSALELYSQYDTIKPKGLGVATYRKLFDLPQQPFKDDWLLGEDYSKYDYSLYEDALSEDSLSTHPINSERVEYLKELFSELRLPGELSPQSKELKEPEEVAYYAVVSNQFNMEQYGVAIYNCMLAIQKGNSTEYFYKWLGLNFEQIYQARKNYRLNKYLAQLVPSEQSGSYQQFLSFMWNLSLKELEVIAKHYAD